MRLPTQKEELDGSASKRATQFLAYEISRVCANASVLASAHESLQSRAVKWDGRLERQAAGGGGGGETASR